MVYEGTMETVVRRDFIGDLMRTRACLVRIANTLEEDASYVHSADAIWKTVFDITQRINGIQFFENNGVRRLHV